MPVAFGTRDPWQSAVDRADFETPGIRVRGGAGAIVSAVDLETWALIRIEKSERALRERVLG